MSRKEKRQVKDNDSGYKPIELKARTPGQSTYIRAMRNSDITFVHGPPGTGKTHVAIGLAVQMIRAEHLNKLIIARPLVSLGKDMGFLPGGIDSKVGPYVIPCFDELNYYLSLSMIKQWQNQGIIEIAPLSTMRGRTLKNAFIIVDEAQNAEHVEVKTLLTRIGDPVRMVMAGDIYQSDLPLRKQGAFEEAMDRLSNLEGISEVSLGPEDIVRHRLISEIDKRLSDFGKD